MHVIEIKVRLTESDAEFLKQLANRNDLPTAVLARMLIVRGLSQNSEGKLSRGAEINGRAA